MNFISNIYFTIKRSGSHLFVLPLFKKSYPVFIVTFFFYLSLFISTSNRTFLLLGLIFFTFLYFLLKDFRKAVFLSFVATLPFAKGKTISLLLLSRELVTQNPLFNLDYSFPLYLSHGFLFMLIYLYLRDKKKMVRQPKLNKSLIFLFLFMILAAASAFFSTHPNVIALTTIQLLILAFVFYLPNLIDRKKYMKDLVQVLAAFVIFQALWVGLQRLSGGPLGLDLEVHLPGEAFGVRAKENFDIYRSSGTFFEPSILGTFMLMHFFFFLSLFLKKDILTKRLRTLIILATSATLVSIIFTASRGVYFLLFITSIIFIYLIKKKGIALKRIGASSKKLLLAVIVILVISGPFMISRLESTRTLFSPSGSATSRIQLNQYALRLAQANPYGVGLNLSPLFLATSFPQEQYTFDPTRPHNIFFQILAEVGFGGLVLFVLFIYFAFRNYLISNNIINNLEFFMASIAFLLGAQIYPIFTNHPEILSFFFLYLGFLSSRKRQKLNG